MASFEELVSSGQWNDNIELEVPVKWTPRTINKGRGITDEERYGNPYVNKALSLKGIRRHLYFTTQQLRGRLSARQVMWIWKFHTAPPFRYESPTFIPRQRR